jgi:hypothetical protein
MNGPRPFWTPGIRSLTLAAMNSLECRRPAAAILAVLLLAANRLPAQETKSITPDRARAEVTALLNEFLARNGEAAEHERFWADDLVYTSSAAKVTTKPEIMKEIAQSDSAAKPAAGAAKEPEITFSADDILVRPYGDIAALTFRLVAHLPDGKTQYYRNSGTFVHRDGRWQAVTWQATKVPDDAK